MMTCESLDVADRKRFCLYWAGGFARKVNSQLLTEFLCGDSEPLALLAFCASDVPNLNASYTGSTLLPQALEKNRGMITAAAE